MLLLSSAIVLHLSFLKICFFGLRYDFGNHSDISNVGCELVSYCSAERFYPVDIISFTLHVCTVLLLVESEKLDYINFAHTNQQSSRACTGCHQCQ